MTLKMRSAPELLAGWPGTSSSRASRKAHDRKAWVAAAYLLSSYVLGGSSRFFVLPHLALRLIAIAAIGYALWTMTVDDRIKARPLALAVLAFGGLMAAQLIPLPPAIWGAMPGHRFYLTALADVGLADRWRPWSMAPDQTLDSLLGMLPVLAAALLFAPLNDAGRRLLLNALLVGVIVSSSLSSVQLASQGFYLYGREGGAGVGFFANRNHQALWLAIGIVLIFARWRLNEHRARPVQIALAFAAAAAILPFLIVAGSRAGLALGIVAFIAGGVVFGRSTIARQTRWVRIAMPAAAFALLALAFAVGTLGSRESAVDRMLQTKTTLTSTELRTANMPAVITTTRTFLPFGSGFNTFDAVFRRFENNAQLQPSYFNHVHSEPIELIIEGGIPAGILLVLALFWLGRHSAVLFVPGLRSQPIILAQVGLLSIVLMLAGSIVDYPLRTPYLAVVAVLLISWVADGRRFPSPVSGLGTTARIG